VDFFFILSDMVSGDNIETWTDGNGGNGGNGVVE
jgi:hypothetical protein